MKLAKCPLVRQICKTAEAEAFFREKYADLFPENEKPKDFGDDMIQAELLEVLMRWRDVFYSRERCRFRMELTLCDLS